jgi:Flp pilus assembly pilin Flp
MRKFFTAFRNREDGAGTVDWVVLTAGLVGLCITALATMETATLGLSNGVADELNERNTF